MIALLAALSLAQAHEMRPSLLELQAIDHERVQVRWALGLANGAPLPLTVELPDGCEDEGLAQQERSQAALTRRWTARCPQGLRAGEIRVQGLTRTGTDVWVRLERGRGEEQRLLRAGDARWPLESRAAAAPTGWLRVGAEHMLSGADHLLFVLGLVLLLRRGALIQAITGFTLGHSLTLGLSQLGWVRVPSEPVELLIAGSVLLLAAELGRADGGAGSLTARWPGVVSVACGLVHGLGFAGAMQGLEMTPGAVFAPLLQFNLGLELAQLGFVGALLSVGWAARGVPERLLSAGRAGMVVAMGAVAVSWVLQRVW